jgi:hypothetical protein
VLPGELNPCRRCANHSSSFAEEAAPPYEGVPSASSPPGASPCRYPYLPQRFHSLSPFAAIVIPLLARPPSSSLHCSRCSSRL